MNKGYFSLLSYDSRISELVKLYVSKIDPDSIIDEHYSESLGEKLEILFTLKTSKYREISKIYQSIFEINERELKRNRILNGKKDYYQTNPQKMLEVAVSLKKIMGDELELIEPEFFIMIIVLNLNIFINTYLPSLKKVFLLGRR